MATMKDVSMKLEELNMKDTSRYTNQGSSRRSSTSDIIRRTSNTKFVVDSLQQMDSHDMIAALEHMAMNNSDVAFDAFKSLKEKNETGKSRRSKKRSKSGKATTAPGFIRTFTS